MKDLIEEYNDAFSIKEGMQLLTQREVRFFKAYIKNDGTNNDKENSRNERQTEACSIFKRCN